MGEYFLIEIIIRLLLKQGNDECELSFVCYFFKNIFQQVDFSIKNLKKSDHI